MMRDKDVKDKKRKKVKKEKKKKKKKKKKNARSSSSESLGPTEMFFEAVREACHTGQVFMVDRFMKKAGPNCVDRDGNSGLHICCQLGGSPDLLSVLLRGDPNLQNRAGETPLHICARKSRGRLAVLLSEDNRTRKDIADERGETAESLEIDELIDETNHIERLQNNTLEAEMAARARQSRELREEAEWNARLRWEEETETGAYIFEDDWKDDIQGKSDWFENINKEIADRRRAELERIASEAEKRRAQREQEAAEQLRAAFQLNLEDDKTQEDPRLELARTREQDSCRWQAFETAVDEGHVTVLHDRDIPWPAGTANILSVDVDDKEQTKEVIRDALRRWHPDKFGRFLALVPENERTLVENHVKSVAQSITALKEKCELPE